MGPLKNRNQKKLTYLFLLASLSFSLLSFVSCKQKQSEENPAKNSTTESRPATEGTPLSPVGESGPSSGSGSESSPATSEVNGLTPTEIQTFNRRLDSIDHQYQKLQEFGVKFIELVELKDQKDEEQKMVIDYDFLFQYRLKNSNQVNNFEKTKQLMEEIAKEVLDLSKSIDGRDESSLRRAEFSIERMKKFKTEVEFFKNFQTRWDYAQERTHSFIDYCNQMSRDKDLNSIAMKIKQSVEKESYSWSCDKVFKKIKKNGMLTINEKESGFNLNDFVILRGLEDLKVINLYGDENLAHHSILNLSPLTKFKELNELVIYNKGLMIKPDMQLPKLKSLTMKNCFLKSTQELKSFQSLSELDLSENLIENIEELSKLKYLKVLNLSYNPLSDISPLQNLIHLENLQLRNARIDDLPDMTNLRSLKFLELRENFISDVTPLSLISTLEHLQLDHNGVSDVTSLVALENLRELDLHYNPIKICPMNSTNKKINDECYLYFRN